MFLVGLQTHLCVSNAACFEVPKEWKESIRALFAMQRKAFFPHPSPHAQALHGTIQGQVQPQVATYDTCIHHNMHIPIRIFSATVHSVRLSYKLSLIVHKCMRAISDLHALDRRMG